MSKDKNGVKESHLKARRTSLSKKSNEELISIILRKDKCERVANQKITSLVDSNFALMRDKDVLEKEQTRLNNRVNDIKDKLDARKSELNDTYQEINNLKTKIKRFKETLFVSCIITAVLVVIMIVLGF